MIEPILSEAAQALATGEDLGEFRDRLPAMFDRMNDAALVQTLRRMGFSAALSGEAGLSEDG